MANYNTDCRVIIKKNFVALLLIKEKTRSITKNYKKNEILSDAEQILLLNKISCVFVNS